MSRLRWKYLLALAIVALGSGVIGGLVAGALRAEPGDDMPVEPLPGKLLSEDKLTAEDWLLGAASDEERFRRLQQQLSGFDQPMLEIGERFSRVHEALSRENYEMALYQWWKIEQRISNAIVKRPKRAASAKAFFLGANYERIRAALQSRTPQLAWAAFDEAKAICLGCHIAEGSAFANQQSVFDLAPPAAHAAGNSKR